MTDSEQVEIRQGNLHPSRLLITRIQIHDYENNIGQISVALL